MVSAIPDPARVNEFYSRFWSSELWGRVEPNDDERLRADIIFGFIEKFVVPATASRNLRILDLGCGRGWLSALLSRYGSVLGVDPVPAAIDRARVLFPDLDVRVADSSQLISAGLEGQFDLVVASEVIEHVVHDQKANFVNDIQRLLKPSGFAILTTPRGELWNLWSRNGGSEQPVEEWISEADLRRLCESVNLRIVATDRIFLSEFPFDWLSRIAARSARYNYFGLREKLRHHRAIYQAILLTRSSSHVKQTVSLRAR